MTIQRVLLCDADGTILDSEEWLIDATMHAVHYFGSQVSRDYLLSALRSGVPLVDFYKEMLPHTDAEKCAEVHIARQRETLSMVEPFTGVCATLESLKKAGVKLGIVTSRRFHELLLATLKRHKIDKFFKAVICMADVNNPKPDPEGIFLALKKLGIKEDEIDTDNVYIVGDSPVDIQAGKRAGIKTIGVLYSFFGEELRESGADYYVSSFQEVSGIVLK